MSFGRALASKAFDSLGGLAVARHLHRQSLRILMYHGFDDAPSLEQHCAHIRTNYHPVSLTQAVEWLRAGRPFPPNTLAVTVDDGYRNFQDVAYPVFKAYDIPSTIYVVSDFADQKLWLWIDQIHYAFEHSTRDEASIGSRVFDLRSRQAASESARRLSEECKLLPNEERLEILRSLPEALDIEIPTSPPPEFAALGWDDLRKLAASGVVEIGTHTRTHPILSRVSSPQELKKEIHGSKQIVEQRLGAPARHFCYPNGLYRDFNAATVEAVREAGYESAVAAESGLNAAGANPFTLLRIGVGSEQPYPYFQRALTGFRV